MKKVLLKKFNFNNKDIVFNEGENYIIGPNASGKTTLFYLMQYCLGLKKSMPRLLTSSFTNNLSLDVSFENKLIHITRQIGSDNIIFDGDIRDKIKASSLSLGDIYNELLQPNIDKDEDRMAAIEILKLTFGGENTSRPFKETNIFKKILGINIMLPIQIKKEIDKFKEEIELENATRRTLQNYINRVVLDLKNEKDKVSDIEYVVNILNKQFLTICNEVLHKNLLLEEAEASLQSVNLHNEELFFERTRIIQPLFYRITTELGIAHTVNICNIFNGKELMNFSGGEIMLLNLAALIILCRFDEYDWHNGCGLLVNDTPHFEISNNYFEDRYRKIISEECKSGKLQYIEFRYDKKSINNNAIVLELDGRGFLYGKEAFA